MQGNTLIIGASGQIGIELTMALRQKHGVNQIIASDVKRSDAPELADGPFIVLDVLDKEKLRSVIIDHDIKVVYLMAALLSATAEKYPEKAWQLNMDGLFHVLDLAKEGLIDRIFWPSSIAVFGSNTPKVDTPQYTVMEPNSVYGISKLAGERWCEYYHQKFGVDVRSIRYPGLIGYRSEPGGGTTDYAVDIFYSAIEHNRYECFLAGYTMLPMMMMEDAIRATISIMDAPSDHIRIRSSYNIAGCSFTPAELANHIAEHSPGFTITYKPDFRQALADSWPNSINDTHARADWGWRAEYDTAKLVSTMMREVSRKKNKAIVTS